jgi:hypothetical protein
VARVEAEECSATFVQTMRAKVRRHFARRNSLPLCERTFRSMHRYGDLNALTAVLSRRTLTRRRIALASTEKLPPRPTLGSQNQAHVGGSIAVVPIHKALVVAGSRRCTEAKLSCRAPYQ